MVLSLRTKLAASIIVVVLVMGVVSTIVGTRLFGDSLVRQVQRGVGQDLNTALLVYQNRLTEIESYVRFAAGEAAVARAVRLGLVENATDLLEHHREEWGLDILTATDGSGRVIARSSAAAPLGDDRSDDQLVKRVLEGLAPVSGTVIVSAAELALESADLAERARMAVLSTPRARPATGDSLSDGMLLKACAPVFARGEFIGTVYGGILLNGRQDIVDRVKETAYKGETWRGKDIGASTIFQDDVRIATNVSTSAGERRLGTLVSEEVYERVVAEGGPWIARAFVVDDWYMTAYEPIRDPDGKTIGILSVGVVSGKFDAMRSRTVWTFAIVSVAGMVLALIIASLLSGGIVRPIRDLATASREIAQGRIDTRVPVKETAAADELTELAQTFNSMAQSIAERDQQLQENARKMTESKKLATLGQLAAGIPHEITNPLGGIIM